MRCGGVENWRKHGMCTNRTYYQDVRGIKMSVSPGRPADFLLSAVLPIYNEEECVSECVKRLEAVMEKLGCRYELVFVNDGSRDRTLEMLTELKGKNDSIRILNLSRNFGHQVAITAGIDHAKGDAIVVLDSDLQDPPEVIPSLLEKWKEGFDIVHAQRVGRKGETFGKKLFAAVYYRLLRQISDVEVPVDVGDFRLISRRAVDAVKTMRERHRYVRGMICWVGFRQVCVPYERDARYAGVPKYDLVNAAKLAAGGIFSCSTVPMRIASYAGFTAVIASIAFVCVTAYAHIFLKMPPHQWELMAILVMFMGGVQLLCLGIACEYIGYLYEETKLRPLYFFTEIE